MKLNRKTLSTAILILISSAAILLCFNKFFGNRARATEMSREEILIKGTYLKLSLYNAAANKDSAELTGVNYNPSNNLKFDISNIHVGPISEVEKQRLYDLISGKSDGNTIRITPHTVEYESGVEPMIMYEAKWKPSDYTSAIVPQDITIGNLKTLLVGKYSDVGKYAKYDVTVNLGGIKRNYKALVLFHIPNYSIVDVKPEFFDLIVGGDALNDILVENRPPFSSAELKQLAKNKNASIFPKEKGPKLSQSISEKVATVPFQCDRTQPMCCPVSASSTDDCCWNSEYPYVNPGIIRNCYGVNQNKEEKEEKKVPLVKHRLLESSSTSSCSYSKRDTPKIEQIATNDSDHFKNSINGGSHSFKVGINSTCEQHSDCYRVCRATGEDTFTETSLLTRIAWPFHSGKDTISETADQGYDDRIYKCQSAYGVGVSGCIIPNCGGDVSMTISSGSAAPNGPQVGLTVTVKGGDLWSYGFGAATSCSFTNSGNSSGGPTSQTCSQTAGSYCFLSSNGATCNQGTVAIPPCCCFWSPVVVDISRYWDWTTNSGTGYQFTDAAGG